MGIYLNPGNDSFKKVLRSGIYIDKSELIAYANMVMDSERCCLCVSRPRRFGKSMAANMLCAYYCRECDSSELFQKLKIAENQSYHQHLNQHDVFLLNVQQFVRGAGTNAVEGGSGWEHVTEAVLNSEKLLEATFNQDEEAVAKGLDAIHSENTSILSYNNENSLSCVITLAYYSARKDYTLIRELPAGKGFADIVFVPRRGLEKPAIIVELKWDKNAEGAIRQIKDNQYGKALEEYSGNVLLVGVNYNKKTKEHDCVIETVQK